MYHFWRQNPLFRPALAFALGIACHEFLKAWGYLVLICAAGVVLQFLVTKAAGISRVHFYGLICFFSLGHFFHAQNQSPASPVLPGEQVLVRLCSEIAYTAKGVRFLADVLGCDSAGHFVPVKKETIGLFFYADTVAYTLLPGDELVVNTRLHPLSGAPNPGTFDYAGYMLRKGVQRQGFVQPGAWTRYGEKRTLHRLAVITRNAALLRIDAFFEEGPESAILKALLCGYTEDIDPETMLAYRVSGTLHILSVSGMHVGILLLVFGKLMLFIRSAPLRNSLLILLLWAYALLTGLSPSVLRAVCMGSLFLLGEAMNRSHSTWNSMAFSLLVLIAWDTHLLFNAGFQLSFLALTGILLCQKRESPARTFRGKARQWFYSFCRISLAAQVFTAPIALYYFHQFPTWFLLGNLLIVPLTGPLMYGGFLFLACSAVPGLSTFLAWCVDLLLQLCYSLTKAVAFLPGATLEGIYFSPLTVALLYAVLFLLALFFKFRQKKPLMVAIALVSVWIVVDGITALKYPDQKGLIVYAAKGKTCLDLYAGQEVHSAGDSLSSFEKQNVCEPFRVEKQLRKNFVLKERHFAWGTIAETDHFRVVRIQKKAGIRLVRSGKRTVVVLEKEAQSPLDLLLESVDFRNIVLSGDLDRKSRKYWKKQAALLHVELHDVLEKGAFQIE